MQNRYRRSLLMVTVLLGAAVGIATQAPAQFIQQGPKLVGSGPVGLAAQGHVALSADGDTAIVGGPGDNGGIGAAWVYTRRGGVWTQQGSKLVGTGAVGNAAQGWSVALSADGNIAIVGGNMDNSGSGAAWVFTRRHGAWTQQGSKLVGNDAVGPNSQQGNSVSLSADGNTAIVGGPSDNGGIGAAWVYTRRGGVWTQHGSKLVGTTGAVGKRAEQGFSVALSADGDTAIVGGPLYSLFLGGEPVGAAWVFTRSDGVWTQQGDKLLGTGVTSGCARQGNSVALSADGDTAIVGGPEDAGCFVFGTGAAWVFTRSDGVWTQQGGKLVGAGGARARQGSSVALSGDGNTAIVGGPCDGCITVAPRRGAAWVFTRTDGIWTQLDSKLVGTGAVGNAAQGASVALSHDGNIAIVGGPSDNGGIGAAWVFIQPTEEDCKEGGWLNFVSPTSPFTFTNQGQCVSYFRSRNKISTTFSGAKTD